MDQAPSPGVLRGLSTLTGGNVTCSGHGSSGTVLAVPVPWFSPGLWEFPHRKVRPSTQPLQLWRALWAARYSLDSLCRITVISASPNSELRFFEGEDVQALCRPPTPHGSWEMLPRLRAASQGPPCLPTSFRDRPCTACCQCLKTRFCVSCPVFWQEAGG